jgi:hypothetical protein
MRMVVQKDGQPPVEFEKLQEEAAKLQQEAAALVSEAATLRINLIKRLDRLTRKLAGEIVDSRDDAVMAKVHDLNATFSVMREMTAARRNLRRSGPRLPPSTIGWIMIGGEPVPIPRGGGRVCTAEIAFP